MQNIMKDLHILEYMKISIIGTGYVGLVTAVGFASKGHEVVCVDISEDKVDKINKGISPIYEENLETLLQELVKKGKLRATTDTRKAIIDSVLTFICVGTPSNQDGSIDTSRVEQAANDIIDGLKDKNDYHVVCVKSTVVPGTTDLKVLPILKESGKTVEDDFGLGMNPEFLREGVALNDFLEPDRIVIGGIDDKTLDVISKAYKDFESPVVKTNIRTAEMIKYASNSLLATKISFANELSRICEKVGIDVYDVMDGVGLDHRINRDFLNAGAGFGGSCFPKDVNALINFAKENRVESKILKSVIEVNEDQPFHIVELLEENLGSVEGKKIALLGLTFKGGTDDVRETRALPIALKLIEKNAEVFGYDPKGKDNFSKLIDKDMIFVDSIKEALEGKDACIIQNDWEEFKNLSSEDFSGMKNKLIVDGRRILKEDKLSEDIRYIGVGRG